MNTFARIHQSIYHSSIAEDWQMRCVFMDLLILADIETGVVNMTHEAISRMTNVPLEIIKENIKKLESPDERSQCREQDGRRLVRIDPARDWGWIIVSWEIWKERSSMAIQREQNRKRVAKFREKKDEDGEVPEEPPKPPASKDPDLSKKAEEIYQAYPKRIAKPKAIAAILKAFHKISPETLLKHTCEYAEIAKQMEVQFIPYPQKWFNSESWNDNDVARLQVSSKSPTASTNPTFRSEGLSSPVLKIEPKKS